jgi:hypothetical protein
MKSNNIGTRGFIAVIAVGIALASVPVSAQTPQINPSVYGDAEFDTQHSQFYLAGLYIGVGGQGWTPYANANVYHLNFRSGGATQSLTGFSPSVGLSYDNGGSGYSFGVGYTWVNTQTPITFNTQTGGENGVTASFGLHANSPSARGTRTELLGDYNFGAHYLWSRARGSIPVGYSTVHPTRVGLEFIAQGGGKSGATSHSFSVGPTLEQKWTPNFSTTLAGGAKFNGSAGTTASNTAAYVSLEFSISP